MFNPLPRAREKQWAAQGSGARLQKHEEFLKGLVVHPKPSVTNKTRWRPGMVAHPVIPVLGRQRKVDICIFETILVYIVSYRTT